MAFLGFRASSIYSMHVSVLASLLPPIINVVFQHFRNKGKNKTANLSTADAYFKVSSVIDMLVYTND